MRGETEELNVKTKRFPDVRRWIGGVLKVRECWERWEQGNSTVVP